MIVLFTDFGWDGPYVGQVKAVIHRENPAVPVVDLLHDAPAFSPMLAAYLLAAFAPEFPPGAVFLGVVDPGVGGARRPVAVRADGHWFIGPDNGLFAIVAARSSQVTAWQVTWRPERLSATFHGRDLFAPVAARVAKDEVAPGEEIDPSELARPEWPDELDRIVYIDSFGNVMTGRRASSITTESVLVIDGTRIERAQTFSDFAPDSPFWFENANGLAEIAVNAGSAAEVLGIRLDDAIYWSE